MYRFFFVFLCYWPLWASAQNSQPVSQPVQTPSSQASSQPSSLPASQASSQPSSLPEASESPEVLAPTEPLEGWEPKSSEPASEPVIEESLVDFPDPPPPPKPGSQIANEFVASLGLAFVGGAAGALGGVIIAAQDNNLSGAIEETTLGWGIGVGLGAGLGAGLSGRSQGRPGSIVGSFVGGVLGSGIAGTVGFFASGANQNGIQNAKSRELFFFVIPFAASVLGSVAGYELFPRVRKRFDAKLLSPKNSKHSSSAIRLLHLKTP